MKLDTDRKNTQNKQMLSTVAHHISHSQHHINIEVMQLIAPVERCFFTHEE
jgi:hypothetical protein